MAAASPSPISPRAGPAGFGGYEKRILITGGAGFIVRRERAELSSSAPALGPLVNAPSPTRHPSRPPRSPLCRPRTW